MRLTCSAGNELRWGCQNLFADGVALRRQSLNCFGHGHYIVEDQQVRHQVAVLDELPPLGAPILGNHAVAGEGDPLYELVESPALGGGGVDGVAELGVCL